MPKPKALICGALGQLGRELVRAAPPGWDLSPHGSATLDVTRKEVVSAVLERERPTLVINASGFTAVDRAESEPELATRVNAAGPAHLAQGARVIGARLIHISTDFVFDGASDRPYRPDDATGPLGVYGRSKLEGERVALAGGDEVLVLRTAWLYAAQGRNFVLTMLRLMKERETLGVVADQVGTPTWARSLAGAIWTAAARPAVRGIHHWTDAGVASWYEFALAIQEEALRVGLLSRAIPIQAIRTGDYPAPARRPAYSVLEKSQTWEALDLTAEPWRVNLRRMLEELAGA